MIMNRVLEFPGDEFLDIVCLSQTIMHVAPMMVEGISRPRLLVRDDTTCVGRHSYAKLES